MIPHTQTQTPPRNAAAMQWGEAHMAGKASSSADSQHPFTLWDVDVQPSGEGLQFVRYGTEMSFLCPAQTESQICEPNK